MNKKLYVILTALLVCALLFAGCAPQAAPAESAAAESTAAQSESAAPSETVEETAQAVVVTDMLGREVTINATDTLVSLAPSATEIIYALGAGDNVVGVDAYSNYPEAAQSVEVVGDFNGPDVEKVVSLEPDVIFCGNTLQQEAIAELENLGMTVVSTEAVAFEDIPDVYYADGRNFRKAARSAGGGG